MVAILIFHPKASALLGALVQGTQNYLPPPPESKIELWLPKSTVDTQILENTGKAYLPQPLRDHPKFGRRGGGR